MGELFPTPAVTCWVGWIRSESAYWLAVFRADNEVDAWRGLLQQPAPNIYDREVERMVLPEPRHPDGRKRPR
jgi:hypothetical protein